LNHGEEGEEEVNGGDENVFVLNGLSESGDVRAFVADKVSDEAAVVNCIEWRDRWKGAVGGR
jgi:hypothetical protein